MDFRILVTGTRHNSSRIRATVHTRLTEINRSAIVPPHARLIIVHGECPLGGVDLYADWWAVENGATPERHPAQRRGNRLLGRERNSRMVAASAQLCLGFPAPHSRGTWDCLRKAVDAGIPTTVYGLTPWHLEGGES